MSRVATLGELTASIAHEVNQPLAGVVTNGEAGLRWLRRDAARPRRGSRLIERMIADARRASEVIKRCGPCRARPCRSRRHRYQRARCSDTLTLVQREIAAHRWFCSCPCRRPAGRSRRPCPVAAGAASI